MHHEGIAVVVLAASHTSPSIPQIIVSSAAQSVNADTVLFRNSWVRCFIWTGFLFLFVFKGPRHSNHTQKYLPLSISQLQCADVTKSAANTTKDVRWILVSLDQSIEPICLKKKNCYIIVFVDYSGWLGHRGNTIVHHKKHNHIHVHCTGWGRKTQTIPGDNETICRSRCHQG